MTRTHRRIPRAAWLLAASLAAPGAAMADDNAVLVWDNAVLQGIRSASKPGPTIAARALAVAHTAMFDAWSSYDATAYPTIAHDDWRRPAAESTPAAKAEAVSYAGHRAVVDLFPSEAAYYDALLASQGYDPSDATTDPSTARGVGNAAAAAVLELRHHDGSNQLGDLAPGAYADYTGYQPVNTPTVVNDVNRWQPLVIVVGNSVVTQSFTTPQWGLVTPFALGSGAALRPAQGPPAYPDPQYQNEAAEIVAISASLDDYEKMQAEYFADGPGTEFPPGHWALFAQFVSRRDGHTLDDDVKLFFALGNGLLDASIAAWDAKRHWDSVRPLTAIRLLFKGVIIQGWGGPGQGTVSMLGEFWRPYQVPNVVTPPFPEFFSGHSVFSATAAEILAEFTGTDAFGFSVRIPAGSSAAEPGLVPAADLTFSWATFSEAAAAAGMSRRYGGIHFRTGDLTGRALGRLVGALAMERARTYFGAASTARPDPPPARPGGHHTRTLDHRPI